MRGFRSDNCAGLCPEALDALRGADDGAHHDSYGDDHWTAAALAAFRALFGERASVWFVAGGTAANTLAIASLTRPWEQVVCHAHSHYHEDESTAPERLTQCRTLAFRTGSTKLTPDDVMRAVGHQRGDVHQVQPGVLTISNPTELGTVYEPAEVTALCRVAHDAGYRVHVDGARFANAVAHLGCAPIELSAAAGVDALSFGGTKNGLAVGEAVIFFPQGDGAVHRRAVEAFPHHRKSTGHLLSKHRFLTAPFAATLREGVWLAHAARANAMAERLARGLGDLGIEPRFDRESNGVFVTLPDEVDAALTRDGHRWYRFGDPSWNLSRLMCSFDTREADVDAVLDSARRAR